MLLNQKISNSNDAVKVVAVDGSGNKLAYYATVKDSPCSAKVTGGNGNDIKLPDGTYDFYYKAGEVYITPSPSSIKYYLMGVDTDGNGETSDNWEADSKYEFTQHPEKENELVL